MPPPTLQHKHSQAQDQTLFKLDQIMNIFQNPQDTAGPKHFSTGIFIGLSSSASCDVCSYLFVVHRGRILSKYLSSPQFDSTISAAFAISSQRSLYAGFHVDRAFMKPDFRVLCSLGFGVVYIHTLVTTGCMYVLYTL